MMNYAHHLKPEEHPLGEKNGDVSSAEGLFCSQTRETSLFSAAIERLTRKVAMAEPIRKPAMTSDQWLRYSATRFKPVRNAKHMSPRDSTGLARRVPFTDSVHVTYIC